MYVIYWTENNISHHHKCGDLPRTETFVKTLKKSGAKWIVTVDLNKEKNNASLAQR